MKNASFPGTRPKGALECDREAAAFFIRFIKGGSFAANY
jgi:hypothetical protein